MSGAGWAERSMILVSGIGGSGKSTYVKEALLHDFDRVIVLDHKREYHFLEKWTDYDGMMTNLARRRHFAVAWQGGNECPHRRAAAAARKAGLKPDPADARCAGWIEHISHGSLALGNLLILVEEGTLYDVPEGSWTEEAILRTGRDLGVSFLFTTQRPVHAHPSMRYNLTDAYFFLTMEPGAIDFARTILGKRGNELAALPQGRALHWTARRAGQVADIEPIKLD